jgi:hypothetical protein
MSSNDEAVSQFLAFTGSSDTSRAASYLEMAGGDLETAVGLFLEHGQSAPMTSTSAGTNTLNDTNFDSSIPMMGQGDDDIRAPDQTRRMRLLDFHDDDHPAPSSRYHNPFFAGGMDNVFPLSVRDRMNAFAIDDNDVDFMDMDTAAAAAAATSIRDLTSASRSIRDVINASASAAADASSSRMNDTSGSYHYDSDDDDNDEDYDDSNNHNDGNEDIIDVEHVYESSAPTTHHRQGPARLHDLFSPPTHLTHSAGGFQGARNVAKDAKRWLLVNLQSDSDFACHALNRDVWRDELVENLIREGFIFWQSINTSADGSTFAHRYKVESFPHISIIDPRTGRLIWRKEGWTQQNPLTAADFAEKVIDFCSQHSLDEPPTAPGKLPAMKNHHPASSETTANHTLTPSMGFEPPMKRPMHEMTEEQQLQAAIRASMNESNRQITIDDDDYVYIDSDQDEADVVESVQKYKTDDVAVDVDGNTKTDSEQNTNETNKPITFEDEILSMDVGEEPTSGTDDIAGIMFRMPNGKRLVRNFSVHDTVKKIYAFVAQSCEGEDSGKPFELKAKYPPKDLIDNVSETILDTGLVRETITVRWKN